LVGWRKERKIGDIRNRETWGRKVGELGWVEKGGK
jgi:hypothetical protein